MRLRPRRSASWIGLVCALAVILIVLAILQIRWSDQVSQAQRERLEANLHIAVTRFRRNFYLELFRVCWTFQTVPSGPPAKIMRAYGDHYSDWMGASAHPGLVAGLFVWRTGRDGSLRLFRFNPASARFASIPWPSEFESLRQNLLRQPSSSLMERPAETDEAPWIIDEQIPALYHAWRVTTGKPETQEEMDAPNGGVIVQLDMNFIRRVLLPMLADRYFRGPEGFTYSVTIMSGNYPARTIYRSTPGAVNSASPTGDVVVDLLFSGIHASMQPPFPEDRNAVHSASHEDANASSLMGIDSFNLEGSKQPFALIVPANRTANWKMIVRHRSGSVEAAVLGLRRRNLTVSFSVLLLLAASMGLILVSAQRAQRLAKLQMDFVANISHELRTPLAIICSAAENLADGVVGAKEQVKNYGALIQAEGRRLSEMMEQILVFAAGRAGPPSYSQRPVDILEIIEAALADAQPTLESGGVSVEKRLESDLPLVLADPSALSRCIQNLISNAIKYGYENRWIGIRAEKAMSRQGPEVRVTVEDRGIGIEPEDLPHIFEPFYRGKIKNTMQIHGTGLGLSIAQEIAEAMGGAISVTSSPGQGSSFTLHLPGLVAVETPTAAG
ncbi:MAG TPA: HAMP domain-containing sensor histidine kinase [Terriglobia bacterium]|nr:HAMP domain-containing sensor histidine kinase [Terriglobia bacterium]